MVGVLPVGVCAAHFDVVVHDSPHVFQVALLDVACDAGGDADDELAVGDDGAGGDECGGADYAAGTDLAAVEDYAADPDQAAAADLVTVDDGAVADRDFVGDVQGYAFLRMNDRAVLDADALSDDDLAHVAAHSHVVHDCGFVADRDVTADVGCGGDVYVLTDGRADDWRAHGRIVARRSGTCEPGSRLGPASRPVPNRFRDSDS